VQRAKRGDASQGVKRRKEQGVSKVGALQGGPETRNPGARVCKNTAETRKSRLAEQHRKPRKTQGLVAMRPSFAGEIIGVSGASETRDPPSKKRRNPEFGSPSRNPEETPPPLEGPRWGWSSSCGKTQGVARGEAFASGGS
jgi:hypothetical protein